MALSKVFLKTLKNVLSTACWQVLDAIWQCYLTHAENIKAYEKALELAIRKHHQCQKLLALEGVDMTNAVRSVHHHWLR